jgi:cysteine synthase A
MFSRVLAGGFSARSRASFSALARPLRVDSIADLIGYTPLVRLRCVIPATSASVLVKLESMNPGGSVKDRIALSMVDSAIASGALRPGQRILEATSGNTGVGLAMVGAARGYGVTLVMPDSMTGERRAMLKAYGATLVLTPGAGGMKEAVRVAAELAAASPGKFWEARQFENAANPAAHAQTAREILQAAPELDAFVAGVGTGGTVTGVGQALQARARAGGRPVRVIAVEPDSSPLLTKGVAGPNKIQGIGANFIPPILDRGAYDAVEDVTYEDAIAMQRRLAREEALLSGISTGAIVHAAAKVAAQLGAGKTVVAILCDTGERYLSHPLYAELPDAPE